ncbi:MAG: alpha/beta fold hydrolase [Burkholderiaceae bacterium]
MTDASPPSPNWTPGAWFDAGDGHRVWWCDGGDPAGRPVLILHGGPGGASRIETTRWFDGLPVRWIVFDQRGCGRSTPAGATRANDLAALAADALGLRERLGIARWGLVGGSWGARVALACATADPARFSGLYLRSPFLGSPAESQRYVAHWHIWLGDAGRQWLGPSRAQAFFELFHPGAIAGPGYGESIGDDEPLARAWSAYDDAQSPAGGVAASGARFDAARLPKASAELIASWRVHAHYAASGWGTSREVWQLDAVAPRALEQAGPVSIVWGEADGTCDPAVAATLARQWPSAHTAAVPGAGHRMGDPRLQPVLAAEARRWALSLGAAPTGAAP